MDKIYLFIFNFVLFFILVYIIQTVFIDKRKKNYSKLKKNDEIAIFIKKYGLDVKVLDFKIIKKTIYLINSFIMAFATSLILNVKGSILQLLVAVIVVLVLTYSLFEIYGRRLKRIQNEKMIS